MWIVKHYDGNGQFQGFEAYGPLVDTAEKATQFSRPEIATQAANNRLGRSNTAFWEGEKVAQEKARKQYRDWNFIIEWA
jgi:hypothetical protein